MKKLFCLSVFALAVLSCQTLENDVYPVSGQDVTSKTPNVFDATIEEAQTKAFLSGTNVYWNDGDMVAVFPGFTSGHKYMVALNSDGKTSTQLVEMEYNTEDYNGDGIKNDEQVPADDTPIGTNVALYPYAQSVWPVYSCGNSCEDLGNGKYRITTEFDGRLPMVAVTRDVNDKNFVFKQAAGILKFNLVAPESDPVGLLEMMITGNDNEIISGEAAITASYDSAPVIEMLDGDSSIGFYFEDLFEEQCDRDGVLWLEPGSSIEFCVPIPPTDFKKGLTVAFATTGGMLTKTISQEVVVERAHIKPLAALPLTPSNTVLYYISTDGNVVTPFTLQAVDKNGNMLQYENVYETFLDQPYGQIKFNGVVDRINVSFKGCTTLKEYVMSTNVIKLMSGNNMFADCTNLTYLDLSYFDFSDVVDMRAMFNKATSLHQIWFGEDGYGVRLNTSNVKDMAFMFNHCESLERIDLSDLNTSNVTTMGAMFQQCVNLYNLDLRNFNTSKVTDMSYMFNCCRGLYYLDVSSFNTSAVTDMSKMFQGCNSLTSLDLSKFDTSNVTDMNAMFWGLYYSENPFSTHSLDLSNFVTSKVENMADMFYECTYLENLDVSSFDTSNVTNMEAMFAWNRAMRTLDVSNFNTSKVTSMYCMFDYCGELTSLDLHNFNTSNVTDFGYMFEDCAKLESIDISNFDTSKATNVEKMFALTPKLNRIKVGEKTNKCAFDSSMFDEIGFGGKLSYPASCDYSQWLGALAPFGWSGEPYGPGGNASGSGEDVSYEDWK